MKTVERICFILLIMCMSVAAVHAQSVGVREVKPTIEYSRIPRTYTIGGIEVEGAKNYDDYVLIGLSGLEIGRAHV